jgi:hypothetical protein
MFCDATGVTKAHVFAESWTSLFDEPNDTREHEVVHRYIDPVTGEQQVLKRAKTFALKSRKVCGTCNSGWLRELEERAKPLMAAFAANSPMILTRDEQADLALWATASSLIAMSLDPVAQAFADAELARRIYRDRRPTTGMDIWLGANAHGEMGWFGSHTLNISQAPEHRGAWGASITFGYAVIHLVCHDLAAEAHHAAARPQSAGHGRRRAVLIGARRAPRRLTREAHVGAQTEAEIVRAINAGDLRETASSDAKMGSASPTIGADLR